VNDNDRAYSRATSSNATKPVTVCDPASNNPTTSKRGSPGMAQFARLGKTRYLNSMPSKAARVTQVPR
jgi:hypothetical protein